MKSLGRVVGALACWLLATVSAQAQVPDMLAGQWAMRQISFLAEHAVPDSVLHRMNNPQVGALNNEIKAGTAQVVVDFRANGTYQFVISRGGQVQRNEVGAYSVQNNTLFAQSPTTEGGSSFNDQVLTKLTRRTLVITFVVGPELPGVLEEVEYRRLN